MTATRSAISATTPRSCVISSSDRPNVLRQIAKQIEHFGLHRDVERRRRFVGDDQRRLGGEGQCEHGALPQAAAQLMRILLGASRRIGDADGFEQFDRHAAGRPRRARGRAPCSVSAI